MKKTNQEIIDAIVDTRSGSFIDAGKEGCTRFFIFLTKSKRSTIGNGLRISGLEKKHLTQLVNAGIIVDYHIDDFTLHIRIKDSFLSDEQRKEGQQRLAKQLERIAESEKEESKKRHAEKCLAMLPKLTEALKEITQFGKCKDKRFSYVTSEERFAELKQLLVEAE